MCTKSEMTEVNQFPTTFCFSHMFTFFLFFVFIVDVGTYAIPLNFKAIQIGAVISAPHKALDTLPFRAEIDLISYKWVTFVGKVQFNYQTRNPRMSRLDVQDIISNKSVVCDNSKHNEASINP